MLRRIIRIAGVVLAALVLLIAVMVILAIVSPRGRIVLPVQHKAQFEHPALSAANKVEITVNSGAGNVSVNTK
ncbi:MAG: hypothetical protein ACETWR_22645 [Anaerolineae bacterium]